MVALLLQQFGYTSLSELVPTIEWLVGGLVAGLVLGAVVGYTLGRRHRRPAPN